MLTTALTKCPVTLLSACTSYNTGWPVTELLMGPTAVYFFT